MQEIFTDEDKYGSMSCGFPVSHIEDDTGMNEKAGLRMYQPPTKSFPARSNFRAADFRSISESLYITPAIPQAASFTISSVFGPAGASTGTSEDAQVCSRKLK